MVPGPELSSVMHVWGMGAWGRGGGGEQECFSTRMDGGVGALTHPPVAQVQFLAQGSTPAAHFADLAHLVIRRLQVSRTAIVLRTTNIWYMMM